LPVRLESLTYAPGRHKEIAMAEQKELPESVKKEIFLALVEAQDHEMSVTQSRKLIAEKFGVSDTQLRQIEREGLDKEWPPL
jgi:hypothetical protein